METDRETTTFTRCQIPAAPAHLRTQQAPRHGERI